MSSKWQRVADEKSVDSNQVFVEKSYPSMSGEGEQSIERGLFFRALPARDVVRGGLTLRYRSRPSPSTRKHLIQQTKRKLQSSKKAWRLTRKSWKNPSQSCGNCCVRFQRIRPRPRCTTFVRIQDGLRQGLRHYNSISAGKVVEPCVRLRPVRKEAGDVRDVDVLTGFSATLSKNGNDQCLVKLLEHLGQERGRSANKLSKTANKHRKAARRSLKDCASLIEKTFDKRSSTKIKQWPIDAMADALRISVELASWPKLSSTNLHPFRLKVKELRYVLQLSGEDSQLADRLDEVKDQIGEWHDWTELYAITKNILSDCKNCKLTPQIEHIVQQKFQTALAAARELRSKYFQRQAERKKRDSKKAAIPEPVLKASAGLAA